MKGDGLTIPKYFSHTSVIPLFHTTLTAFQYVSTVEEVGETETKQKTNLLVLSLLECLASFL